MSATIEIDEDAPTGTEPVGPPTPPPPPSEGWRTDSAGREFIPKPQGRGMIYRQGKETVEAALERDAQPRDKRPKRKPKAPKMPEPPKKVDLKELEKTLAEALRTPAMLTAAMGDEWATEHFTTTGPYLARNLILASEHNPWLRAKLEEASTGQDAMMKVMSLIGVGGALFMYTAPPIVYWFNLPVPDKMRQQFGIPPRKERPPEYAVPSSPPQPEPAPFE